MPIDTEPDLCNKRQYLTPQYEAKRDAALVLFTEALADVTSRLTKYLAVRKTARQQPVV